MVKIIEQALNAEQQKALLKQVIAQQQAQSIELLEAASPKLNEQEHKRANILILRALNTCTNFNVDTQNIIKDIQEILKHKEPLLKLNSYCQNLYHYADQYKEVLDNTQSQGLKKRREVNPVFPDSLQNKNTVYIPIEVSLSAYQVIEQQVSQLNKILPNNNRIIYNSETKKLSFDKQEHLLGAFFSRRHSEIGKVLSSEIDYQDTELAAILVENDYKNLVELRKTRSMSNNLQNRDLIKLLGDKILFHQISDALNKQYISDFEVKLFSSLKNLRNSYLRTAQTIKFSQDKGQIQQNNCSIDMLIVSVNPHLLSTQSEYKNWRNCTSANDYNHSTIIDAIGEGSIIVYGVNSQNPQQKISRILLNPYKSEHGDIVYHPNKTYGEYNLAFSEAVSQLAQELSSDKLGIYKANSHLYSDGAPKELIHLDNALDYCQAKKITYQLLPNGKLKCDKIDASNCGFKELPKFFENLKPEILDLSHNPLRNLEHCPAVSELYLTHCTELNTHIGKEIPDSVKVLNARFSNFDGTELSTSSSLEILNLSNNDDLAPDFIVNLPTSLRVLEVNATNLTNFDTLNAPNLERLSAKNCDLRADAFAQISPQILSHLQIIKGAEETPIMPRLHRDQGR